ncbi:putative zinc finger protein [Apostichopus japonicus]|uniref:Putative zinc finger protein n=1 Tax=Stichopus japonicus TaxID=307972 RepID=A0A2G8KGZ7_STIJA|nr:putative zinc finger protein [Apostichopus japonicus]
MTKDHGKNYESKASTEKNEKITTTPDEDGGQTETEKLKLSTKSDTESMNMQRQCERSDESFPEVISRVDLKGECLDSVRNSGMESKVKEKEDKGLAKSKTKHDKTFKCEFCEDLFTSNKYRYKHRVASHPKAVFQCPGCEKSYKVTEKDKWQHHIRTHNKPPKKPKLDSYSCSVCSVVFRAPNAVAIHMQTFHPEAVRGEKRFLL